MRAGMLTASVSWQGGGISAALRGLGLGLNGLSRVETHIFALEDVGSAGALPSWAPLPVHLAKVCGPKSFGYAPTLLAKILAIAPDVLHVHGIWMYPSVASLRWARRTNQPMVISPHGMLDVWAVRNSYWKKWLVGRLYEDRHLRRAGCLHALCESEAEAIRAYGLRDPICVLPNGVNLPDDFASARPTSGQWPDGAKVLLYLGRLHVKKGLIPLIEAWARVARNHPSAREWHLAIAGWDQGGHEAELKALVSHLGIQDRVCFLGAQFGVEKEAVYRNASAFILPSVSEGLPMVVLEAWSHRLPVLITPQCNLPEGVRADAALAVEPISESIADGLGRLLDMSDAERATMGSNGRQLVETTFAWSQISAQMFAVYEWLVGGGERPACVWMP